MSRGEVADEGDHPVWIGLLHPVAGVDLDPGQVGNEPVYLARRSRSDVGVAQRDHELHRQSGPRALALTDSARAQAAFL